MTHGWCMEWNYGKDEDDGLKEKRGAISLEKSKPEGLDVKMTACWHAAYGKTADRATWTCGEPKIKIRDIQKHFESS